MNAEAETSSKLRAPFPWFGGKSRAAHLVWPRFGDVHNYVEPFAGSLAVLLNRPHAPRVETVNDLDCYLANFWRALQADPEAVAYYADQPVNEADLHGRHRWLVERGRRRVLRCLRDPHYFNAKIAGWWVYGQCLWIGSGWCQAPAADANYGRAGYGAHQRRRPQLSHDQGITSQRTAATRSGENPHLQHKKFRSDGSGVHAGVLADDGLAVRRNLRGAGVHQKRFAGTGNGQGAGVHRRWQGGGERGGGSGVHAVGLTRQKPQLSGDGSGEGRGLLGGAARTQGLYDYLEQLAARLRRVRVCCGEWGRVLTPNVTTYIGITAVFLDPPYGHELRERCYAEDHNVAAAVRTWALEHGDDEKFRIALCGYEGEHAMPASWACVPWKAHGGYSRSERGVANRERERIWFSPHCLPDMPPLFAEVTS